MKDYYFYTESLTVGYNNVPLIKNIEIKLKKGEILTLIGPNGAGKTTILKSIMQQLEKVSGAIYIDNKDISGMSRKLLAQKMSVVLTQRVQAEMMTCEDIVATGRYPYTGHFGMLSDTDMEIVRDSMKMVNVEELADRDYNKISDGQKQRVMLARAICQEPDIILLDEPTSFLDIKYKLEFLSVLQKLSEVRNLTVVMSLHELDLAGKISDKILCVKGDKVDKFGTPEEIFSKGYIPELYGMTVGSYDEISGDVELDGKSGTPEVFVITGGGTGTQVMRRLQREHRAFAAGIIWENDLDYPVARSLASEIVAQEAFSRFSEENIEKAKKYIDECKSVICTLDIDRERDYMGALCELYDYAVQSGKIEE